MGRKTGHRKASALKAKKGNVKMETGKNLLNFNLILLGGLQLEYVDGSGFVLR